MTLYISIKIIKIITLRYEHRTITVRESAHNVTQDINHTLKELRFDGWKVCAVTDVFGKRVPEGGNGDG